MCFWHGWSQQPVFYDSHFQMLWYSWRIFVNYFEEPEGSSRNNVIFAERYEHCQNETSTLRGVFDTVDPKCMCFTIRMHTYKEIFEVVINKGYRCPSSEIVRFLQASAILDTKTYFFCTTASRATQLLPQKSTIFAHPSARQLPLMATVSRLPINASGCAWFDRSASGLTQQCTLPTNTSSRQLARMACVARFPIYADSARCVRHGYCKRARRQLAMLGSIQCWLEPKWLRT